MPASSIADVRQIFETEFASVADKFEFFELSKPDFRDHTLIRCARPGTYVWWDGSCVLKVGVSMVNARERALQHIRDNTGGKCASIDTNTAARLLLFTTDKENSHWAASVEFFLERELRPAIPSKRVG